MKMRAEPRALDVSDLEEGVVAEHCFACRKKQSRYQRIETLNQIGVCRNPECFRYDNPNMSPSWVRVD